MKTEFEKHACEFKNEAKCEEELEEGGISLDESEKEYYEDEK